MFLLLAFSFLSVPLAAQTKESPLVFSRVTVIDVVSGRATPDMTVVVEGPRITAVGKSGRVKLPRGAQTIDDSGTYLIPGLWDMHVHSLFEGRYDWFFPMLIANGITGVRELGTICLLNDSIRSAGRFRKENFDRLAREVYLAFVDEAKRQALPVAGIATERPRDVSSGRGRRIKWDFQPLEP